MEQPVLWIRLLLCIYADADADAGYGYPVRIQAFSFNDIFKKNYGFSPFYNRGIYFVNEQSPSKVTI